MTFKATLVAAAAVCLTVVPAFAGDTKIMIEDPYMRSSNSVTAAVFMGLMNHTDKEDRLISATASISERVELHSHQESDDGVMRMIKLEDGIAVPANGMHALKRGGDHVMFIGLNAPLEQGQTVELTLTFEKAGEVVVSVPVDNERQDAHGHGDHSGHTHSD